MVRGRQDRRFVLISRNATCSSCRACEAASGCAAVANSGATVYPEQRSEWFYDCFAVGRRLDSGYIDQPATKMFFIAAYCSNMMVFASQISPR
jgi:hypothetical protein